MADQKAMANASVSFCIDGVTHSCNLVASLHADSNNNKTSFAPGETAHIAVETSSSSPITTWLSQGTFIGGRTVIEENAEENLTFVDTKRQSLSVEPIRVTGMEWQGNHMGGAASWDGGTDIVLGSVGRGLLKVTYVKKVYIYKVQSTCAGEVLAIFDQECGGDPSADRMTAHVSIPYEGRSGGRRVKLKVKDYCSDAGVPTATVSVSGPGLNITKTTDGSGFIDLGELPVGATYSVSITAAGYTPSDSDGLRNDSFTVPPEEGRG